MSHELEQQPTPVVPERLRTVAPVVPERLRTVAYIAGTLVLVFATSVGDALPDPWGRLATGFGAACLALAVGYRPTR